MLRQDITVDETKNSTEQINFIPDPEMSQEAVNQFNFIFGDESFTPSSPYIDLTIGEQFQPSEEEPSTKKRKIEESTSQLILEAVQKELEEHKNEIAELKALVHLQISHIDHLRKTNLLLGQKLDLISNLTGFVAEIKQEKDVIEKKQLTTEGQLVALAYRVRLLEQQLLANPELKPKIINHLSSMPATPEFPIIQPPTKASLYVEQKTKQPSNTQDLANPIMRKFIENDAFFKSQRALLQKAYAGQTNESTAPRPGTKW